MIAPQPIENKLKANVLVGQALWWGQAQVCLCADLGRTFSAGGMG